MGKANILDIVRSWIGEVGLNMFLWSINMTQEQFREEIYFDELSKRSPDEPRKAANV